MKILNLKQNTKEWEEFRMAHIGASDIGLLMGATDKQKHDLMQVKRGLKKNFVTEAMKRGSEMESEAIEWLTGTKPTEKVTALHDQHDWLMASFDYIDLDGPLMCEVKCPKTVLDEPCEHDHYKDWYWQIQAQLAVSGRESCLLLVYSPFKQTQEWVQREEEAIRLLLKRGKEFYDKMINFEDIIVPEVLERQEPDVSEWALRYREVDEKIKELEEEKKVLRDEGVALAGDDSFVCEGVKVMKVASRITIDYEAACKAHKIDLTSYRKPPKSPYTWRISAS